MTLALIIVAVFWLAWSNGANDNFKGVATLYGSGTTSYRGALAWATITTFIGSLVSLFLADKLVKTFSGAGLVSAELAKSPLLLIAVATAAAITILLATWLGMPTSTTHALAGSLVGAAMVADFKSIRWDLVTSNFAKPLLISPALAVAIAATLYLVLHRLRLRAGISAESCVCVGQAALQPATGHIMRATAVPAITVGTTEACAQRYAGSVVGIEAQSAVDFVHYLSGGAVCFARALNDTPKIVGLLLVTGGSIVSWKIGLIAAAMAIGGLLGSRRVATTMSKGITRELNSGQGLTASLVTAALVLGASRLGVPVSTTHVSCGSIFGMGLVNGNRNWRVIAQIATAWLTTLPLGLALGASVHWLIRLGA